MYVCVYIWDLFCLSKKMYWQKGQAEARDLPGNLPDFQGNTPRFFGALRAPKKHDLKDFAHKKVGRNLETKKTENISVFLVELETKKTEKNRDSVFLVP